jgi:hypothetical protein
MSDHRFEKQVGQKLDDLKLTPSAKSWENIEKELRRDKRRAAPVFWLPLLLLGLGAIGYFVFNKDNGNPKQAVIADHKNNPVLHNNSLSNTAEAPKSENIKTPGSADIKTSNEKRRDENAIVFATQSSIKKYNTAGKETKQSTEETTDQQIQEDEANQHISSEHLPALKNEEQEPVSKQNEKDTLEQTPASASAVTPQKQKKKTKRWAFGMNASGGVSTLSEGKIGFNNTQIATVLNRQQVPAFASPAVMPPPSTSPSKIYPGLSFSAGLTAKYHLSKRFSLSTGINYLQMNTISKVGYKLEQSSNALANMNAITDPVMYLPPANDEVRDYDNKYHFIELPVNLHTRINKSEKLPLFINAGFVMSKLIKSNSLHYDAIEHYYYSDDNLLKKTQTAVSTGISFVVFNKTKTPLWIGPTVRYNLSKALKAEISPSNKHFMGVGLDMKWFIK